MRGVPFVKNKKCASNDGSAPKKHVPSLLPHNLSVPQGMRTRESTFYQDASLRYGKNQLCGTWIIPQIMSVRNRIRNFFFPFFQINTIIRQFGSVMPFSFRNLRKIQSGKASIFQKYHWQTFVLMLSCESWQEILPTTEYSKAHHEK